MSVLDLPVDPSYTTAKEIGKVRGCSEELAVTRFREQKLISPILQDCTPTKKHTQEGSFEQLGVMVFKAGDMEQSFSARGRGVREGYV